MQSLMSCSVHFSVAVFFQTTAETNSLVCLEVSCYHVFNWFWDQEAVVHGQFSVASVTRTTTKAQS